jgi:hypothetical protein
MNNENKKTNTKTKSTKSTTKKTTKAKPQQKTRKQLVMELRKRQDEIIVEIYNISAMTCSYTNRNGIPYFTIEPNEYAEVTLEELYEVVTKTKGFFSDYSIIVTDVLNDDCSLDDVMVYLGLDKMYKDVDGLNSDFINEILELDDSDFEYEIDKIKNRNKTLVQAIASKAIYLTKSEYEDFEISRKKSKILSEALGREKLIFED